MMRHHQTGMIGPLLTRMASRMRSAASRACSRSVSGRIRANSSPPYRHETSVDLPAERSCEAPSTSSPKRCPYRSFILETVEIAEDQERTSVTTGGEDLCPSGVEVGTIPEPRESVYSCLLRQHPDHGPDRIAERILALSSTTLEGLADEVDRTEVRALTRSMVSVLPDMKITAMSLSRGRSRSSMSKPSIGSPTPRSMSRITSGLNDSILRRPLRSSRPCRSRTARTGGGPSGGGSARVIDDEDLGGGGGGV